MQVYIEYILFDNLVINFLILFCVAKILRIDWRFLRVLLSALFGAVAVFWFAFISSNFFLQFGLKVSLGGLMIILAFNLENFKQFLVNYLTFIFLTFLFGGASFAIILIFNSGEIRNGVLTYNGTAPIGIIIFTAAIVSYFIIRLGWHIYKRRDCYQFLALIKLKVNGADINLRGFIDSGNRLFDPVSGLPVIIVSSKAIKAALSEEFIKKFTRAINFGTLSGNGGPIIIFKPDSTTIKLNNRGINAKVMVGISRRGFNDAFKYDALINPGAIN